MPEPKPQIARLVLGPLQTNCYLLRCPDTGSALVIDPAAQADRILRHAQAAGARIEQILLTHGHLDHLGGLPDLRAATGAPVLLHRLEVEMLEQYMVMNGFEPDVRPSLLPDVLLEGGETLTVGSLSASVIHTPGHSPGSITLRLGNVLFTGDTLFAQGVGRVDLSGGSLDQLLASIQRLFTLPDDCAVYPGHGPASTIGVEKRSNPYV